MNLEDNVLRVGDPAPDLTLQDGSGSEVRLGGLWSDQPLLLVFLRHYG